MKGSIKWSTSRNQIRLMWYSLDCTQENDNHALCCNVFELTSTFTAFTTVGFRSSSLLVSIYLQVKTLGEKCDVFNTPSIPHERKAYIYSVCTCPGRHLGCFEIISSNPKWAKPFYKYQIIPGNLWHRYISRLSKPIRNTQDKKNVPSCRTEREWISSFNTTLY